MGYDVTDEAAARAAADDAIWQPSDNGLIAANFQPRHVRAQNAPAAGNYYLNRVKVPAGKIITNVHAIVQAAGASLTYAAAAVYEANGTRVGITADQTASWNSIGHKVMALGAPVAAQAATRYVWVAFATAGTTQPTWPVSDTAGSSWTNINLAQPLNAGYVAGAAPLPASLTMTLTTYFEIWAGLS